MTNLLGLILQEVALDCLYWFSVPSQDKSIWWDSLVKAVLGRFTEGCGEDRVLQLKSFHLGMSAHGSVKQRSIRQPCCDMKTF